MTKQEFLEGLRRSLASTGSEQLIAENLSYYRDYIDGEIKKGRSEDEIMADLGEPRLIAKTIKDAAGYTDTFVVGNDGREKEDTYTGGYTRESDTERDYTDTRRNDQKTSGFSLFGKSALVAVVVALVLILLLGIVFISLVGGIFTWVFSLLGPVVGTVVVVILIIYFLRGFGR